MFVIKPNNESPQNSQYLKPFNLGEVSRSLILILLL